MPIGVVFRVFLIGSIAIGASGYAIYRHYYVPRPSMLMPVPAPSASDLIPAPNLVP